MKPSDIKEKADLRGKCFWVMGVFDALDALDLWPAWAAKEELRTLIPIARHHALTGERPHPSKANILNHITGKLIEGIEREAEKKKEKNEGPKEETKPEAPEPALVHPGGLPAGKGSRKA